MKIISNFICSFRFAFEGFGYAIRTQKNLRIHLLFALFIISISLLLRCTGLEIAILLIIIAMVVSMELINTSIEATINLISPHNQPLAKIAKDLGAAAVLISAFFSIAIGLIIFLPKIFNILF